MPDLKLIALDAEDLAILSAHLQDAVITVGDMAYQKGERRFVAIANRFDWERAHINETTGGKVFERRRAGVRFENVTGAEITGFDQRNPGRVLSLLAVSFSPISEPEGYITLQFSGGMAVRLRVECIEAGLNDLGAAWATRSQPRHEV